MLISNFQKLLFSLSCQNFLTCNFNHSTKSTCYDENLVNETIRTMDIFWAGVNEPSSTHFHRARPIKKWLKFHTSLSLEKFERMHLNISLNQKKTIKSWLLCKEKNFSTYYFSNRTCSRCWKSTRLNNKVTTLHSPSVDRALNEALWSVLGYEL